MCVEEAARRGAGRGGWVARATPLPARIARRSARLEAQSWGCAACHSEHRFATVGRQMAKEKAAEGQAALDRDWLSQARASLAESAARLDLMRLVRASGDPEDGRGSASWALGRVLGGRPRCPAGTAAHHPCKGDSSEQDRSGLMGPTSPTCRTHLTDTTAAREPRRRRDVGRHRAGSLLVLDIAAGATDQQRTAYNDDLVSAAWRSRDDDIPVERSRNRWNPKGIPATRVEGTTTRRSPCRCCSRIRHARFSRRRTGEQTRELVSRAE